jgi:hypothetical protein
MTNFGQNRGWLRRTVTAPDQFCKFLVSFPHFTDSLSLLGEEDWSRRDGSDGTTGRETQRFQFRNELSNHNPRGKSEDGTDPSFRQILKIKK